MSHTSSTAPRVAFCTLGCRVNQYESDAIAACLEVDGFQIVPFGQEADVTIVNTCTVTAESDRKSRQHIRRAAAANPGKPLIVTGCFAQVSPDAAAAIPGVTAVIGNGNKGEIAAIVRRLTEGMSVQSRVDDIGRAAYDDMILLTPRRSRSYIKIQDGCENRCAYCIIPAARGRIRSKQPCDVLTEAAALAEAGCHEIILTGIETAAYGRDSGGAFTLAGLMAQLNDVPGIERIGLGSLEPTLMRERFLSEIAPLKTVLPHFHISLQSGSSSVLRRMRRPYNAAQAMDFIHAVREYFPEAMLTADVIVGFPGETEAEFEETMAFCREAKLLHLHIFPYSIRQGTEAAAMPDQIPACVKKQRAADLAKQQAEIKRSLLEEYVAAHKQSPVHVLIEEEKKGYLVGHSEHYVEIRLKSDAGVIGETVPVTLSGTDGNVCFSE